MQCKCLIDLCGFLLHLPFRSIDLHLSLLDFSHLPPLLLRHLFFSRPSRISRLPERRRSLPTMLSALRSLGFAGKPCRAPEGQTDRVGRAPLGKLFSVVTAAGRRGCLGFRVSAVLGVGRGETPTRAGALLQEHAGSWSMG